MLTPVHVFALLRFLSDLLHQTLLHRLYEDFLRSKERLRLQCLPARGVFQPTFFFGFSVLAGNMRAHAMFRFGQEREFFAQALKYDSKVQLCDNRQSAQK